MPSTSVPFAIVAVVLTASTSDSEVAVGEEEIVMSAKSGVSFDTTAGVAGPDGVAVALFSLVGVLVFPSSI